MLCPDRKRRVIRTVFSCVAIVALGAAAGCDAPAEPPASSGQDTAPTAGAVPTPGPPAPGRADGAARPAPPADPFAARVGLLESERAELDQTVWADEMRAQEYEQTIVHLWDRLNVADDPLSVLADARFERLALGEPADRSEHAHGIGITYFADPANGAYRALAPEDWRAAVAEIHQRGYRIEMTEWHQSSFDPDVPRSTFSFTLYGYHADRPHRFQIDGNARIDWTDRTDRLGLAVPGHVAVTDLRLAERRAEAPFEPMAALPLPGAGPEHEGRIQPLLVYDLDGSGLDDVVLVGANEVYWNRGDGRFEGERLVRYRFGEQRSAVIADFTGNGLADLVCASHRGAEGRLLLYQGDENGRFHREPHVILSTPEHALTSVSVLSAGDITGNGRLDLFVGQYKPPYHGGQMPTPYYDANDGFPSYLLRNDGEGRFTDVTAEAGLADKQHRRVYSASLVDLNDNDRLDLLVVSDFAGVDLYHNDGEGRFSDVTDTLPRRHTYGMAHTFDDFNRNGWTDFYAIGMSSTTARRLEHLGLGRRDMPDRHEMRMAMGYGNLMYLSDGEGGFTVPDYDATVARTGWSWGASSFDFDNDGYPDIYVANGHISGESTRDYCSTYWRHDIYFGDSRPDPALEGMFLNSLAELNEGRIMWDGYQKNVLFMNEGGEGFLDVAHLMGVAFEFDARAAATADLTGDGRADVLVVQEHPADAYGRPKSQTLHLVRNRFDGGNWIGVRLREHGDGFSPVGAKVTLVTGDPDDPDRIARIVTGDSFFSQHPPVAHFGLGERTEVQAIEVRWPNGQVTRIEAPSVNQYHQVDPHGR